MLLKLAVGQSSVLGRSLQQEPQLCHLQSMNSRLVGQKAQTSAISAEQADSGGLEPRKTKIYAPLIWIS